MSKCKKSKSKKTKNKNLNRNKDLNKNKNYDKNKNDNKDIAYNTVRDKNVDINKNVNHVNVNPKISINNMCKCQDTNTVRTPQLVFDQGMFEGIGQDFVLVSEILYSFVGGLAESGAILAEPLVFHASLPHVAGGLSSNEEANLQQTTQVAEFILTRAILLPTQANNGIANQELAQEQELYRFVDTAMTDMAKVTSFQYVDFEVSLPAVYRLYARVDSGTMDSTSEFSFTARQYEGRP
ncbi:hypothetical protein [Vallitalea okinawensis]|uniref:hypothetical protein n=1 Tax=Vallitalea okinawensis TaxID=2078660 RepID=UPI000CFB3CCE|nr:hypothetical protein [Vallitalea okinawensis]